MSSHIYDVDPVLLCGVIDVSHKYGAATSVKGFAIPCAGWKRFWVNSRYNFASLSLQMIYARLVTGIKFFGSNPSPKIFGDEIWDFESISTVGACLGCKAPKSERQICIFVERANTFFDGLNFSLSWTVLV